MFLFLAVRPCTPAKKDRRRTNFINLLRGNNPLK
nr:MAG TPA: hypothetical protein [Caudoviricetes sp.]